MIEVQELIGCEGALRDDFECIMSKHHYAIDRNQHGEYTHDAVNQMWIGFCLASAHRSAPHIQEPDDPSEFPC
ncbi:hypothetical protein [Aeromonas caviae]